MGYSAAGLALIAGGGYITGKGPAGSLKPKAPALPPVPPMPNQDQLLQAQQLQEAKDAASRYGRASTILTTNTDTGDKLGP